MQSTNESISNTCFMPQATVFTTKKQLTEKKFIAEICRLFNLWWLVYNTPSKEREGLKSKIRLFIHFRKRLLNDDM